LQEKNGSAPNFLRRRRRLIRDGDHVRVFNQRGEIVLTARVNWLMGDADLELWLRRSVEVRRIPRSAVRRVRRTRRSCDRVGL